MESIDGSNEWLGEEKNNARVPIVSLAREVAQEQQLFPLG